MPSLPFQLQIPLPFPHPPSILTSLEALPANPYLEGNYLLNRPRGPLETDAFGFAWQFIGTPAGVGESFLNPATTFEEYLAVVMEVKSDIGATTFNGEQYFLQQDEGRIQFSEFPITRISVRVLPACALNLYWILFL
jgi:hypothetical protein